MKIKAKQIAEHLGVSQATVSLAINNKSGVRKETRQKILEYIEELKQKEREKKLNKSIKMLSLISERASYDREKSDFHSTTLMEFSKIANNSGFSLNLVYIHNEDEIPDIIEKSLHDGTGGLLLLASDMNDKNLLPFVGIDIPVIICDNEFENMEFDSVCTNNRQGVRLAMNYLYKMGHRNIFYFYNTYTIHNFIKRREAFKEFMIEKDLNLSAESMLEVGYKIEEIYDNLVKYIKNGGKICTAIVTENYAISIATIKALQDCGYQIPDDISIIGIDELPPYLLTDFDFTYVKMSFQIKARHAMKRLIKVILDHPDDTIQILVGNELIEGNSVKRLENNIL